MPHYHFLTVSAASDVPTPARTGDREQVAVANVMARLNELAEAGFEVAHVMESDMAHDTAALLLLSEGDAPAPDTALTPPTP